MKRAKHYKTMKVLTQPQKKVKDVIRESVYYNYELSGKVKNLYGLQNKIPRKQATRKTRSGSHLEAKDLTLKNGTGKVISKKASAASKQKRSYRNIKLWGQCVKQVHESLPRIAICDCDSDSFSARGGGGAGIAQRSKAILAL